MSFNLLFQPIQKQFRSPGFNAGYCVLSVMYFEALFTIIHDTIKFSKDEYCLASWYLRLLGSKVFEWIMLSVFLYMVFHLFHLLPEKYYKKNVTSKKNSAKVNIRYNILRSKRSHGRFFANND